MSARAIVEEFYKYDVLLETDNVNRFLHPDITLEWHSTKGFLTLSKEQIMALSSEMSKAYVRSKTRVTHIVEEGEKVAVRYSHYAKTIENPREEMLLAHFMVIWELKDGKLYKGFQMSQL
jgi:predicted SnoaL-like aldol condensation-catalyzing enzyme